MIPLTEEEKVIEEYNRRRGIHREAQELDIHENEQDDVDEAREQQRGHLVPDERRQLQQRQAQPNVPWSEIKERALRSPLSKIGKQIGTSPIYIKNREVEEAEAYKARMKQKKIQDIKALSQANKARNIQKYGQESPLLPVKRQPKISQERRQEISARLKKAPPQEKLTNLTMFDILKQQHEEKQKEQLLENVEPKSPEIGPKPLDQTLPYTPQTSTIPKEESKTEEQLQQEQNLGFVPMFGTKDFLEEESTDYQRHPQHEPLIPIDQSQVILHQPSDEEKLGSFNIGQLPPPPPVPKGPFDFTDEDIEESVSQRRQSLSSLRGRGASQEQIISPDRASDKNLRAIKEGANELFTEEETDMLNDLVNQIQGFHVPKFEPKPPSQPSLQQIIEDEDEEKKSQLLASTPITTTTTTTNIPASSTSPQASTSSPPPVSNQPIVPISSTLNTAVQLPQALTSAQIYGTVASNAPSTILQQQPRKQGIFSRFSQISKYSTTQQFATQQQLQQAPSSQQTGQGGQPIQPSAQSQQQIAPSMVKPGGGGGGDGDESDDDDTYTPSRIPTSPSRKSKAAVGRSPRVFNIGTPEEPKYNVRMLPSIQRQLKQPVWSDRAGPLDYTIQGQPITTQEEKQVLERIQHNIHRELWVNDLSLNLDQAPGILDLPPSERIPGRFVLATFNPQMIQDFISNDTAYNQILNKLKKMSAKSKLEEKVKADSKLHWVLAPGDPTANRLSKLRNDVTWGTLLFDPISKRGYGRSGAAPKPVNLIQRERLEQLALIVTGLGHFNMLGEFQRTIGTRPEQIQEFKNFSEEEMERITHKEQLFTRGIEPLLQTIEDELSDTKVADDIKDRVKALRIRMQEAELARANDFISSEDYENIVESISDEIRNIIAEEPEASRAGAKFDHGRRQFNIMVDFRVFNDRINYIKRLIEENPNTLWAKKLEKTKNSIINDLKTGEIDLNEAFDKMNGVYNHFKNKIDEYSIERAVENVPEEGLSQGLEYKEKRQLVLKQDKEKELNPSIPRGFHSNPGVVQRKMLKATLEEMRKDISLQGMPLVAYSTFYLDPKPTDPTTKKKTRDKGVQPLALKATMIDQFKQQTLASMMDQANKTALIYNEMKSDGKEEPITTSLTDLIKAASTNESELAKLIPNITTFMSLRNSISRLIDTLPGVKFNTKSYRALDENVKPAPKTYTDKKLYTDTYNDWVGQLYTFLTEYADAEKTIKDYIGAKVKDVNFKNPHDIERMGIFRKPIDQVVKHLKPKVLRKVEPILKVKKRTKPKVELVQPEFRGELSRAEIEKRKLEQKVKFSEGNFKYAKRITKEEPEINKAYYGPNIIEFNVKNEADLQRMKSEVSKQSGKLFIVDLATGRLFPIEIHRAFVGQNYIFVKEGVSQESLLGKRKLQKKPRYPEYKHAKVAAEGGGFEGMASAYYPTLHAIHKMEESELPYIFMRNGRDKARQMAHLVPQKKYFNDYRDQMRKEEGGGLWKSVRKGLTKLGKSAGNYTVNKTFAAARDLGTQTVYEGRHFIKQQQRNINYIGNANKQLYKDPSFNNLNRAINRTVVGGVRFASQPLVTAARETANVSDFLSRVPGVNVAKSALSFFVPPVAVANALVHGVKNVDEGKYIDAAINAGDALIGSGKLKGSVDLGARIINTGVKAADSLFDKSHNKPNPPP